MRQLKDVSSNLDKVITAAKGLQNLPNILKKLAISKSGLTGKAAAETGASAATAGFGAALSAAGAAAKSFFVALATNPITYIVAGLVAVAAIAYKQLMLLMML